MDIEKELRLIRQELERIATAGRPLPGLVTKEQAAEFLSVSKATIDRMVERREIRLAPMGGKGRHPRIPMSELHRLATPVAPASRGAPKKGKRFDIHAEVAKLDAHRRGKR